ncbi:MAG: 4-hydroxythreonine-4-phosphate dehydrogenase PdxA [Polyangiaceae bacterium]|nr:4-hydroxythreonine-4-phosphate dehydrogenase PdxA [Polyangiaceae bacterium]
MPKIARAAPRPTSPEPHRRGPARAAAARQLFVSLGCPAGVGPEVAVRAAAARPAATVLVGDPGVVERAAALAGIDPSALRVHAVGAPLSASDHRPGRPSRAAGAAQLAWVEAAFALARGAGGALVTGPVSKEAIAGSGRRAARFRGHTEWLAALDGGVEPVMCFFAPGFATSLVTTHLPLARVPRALTVEGVARATLELVGLLAELGAARPRIAVCSLNPHAGEGGLLGREEAEIVAPGVRRAARALGRRATLVGPIGAETAYRKAAAGEYAGVVAMYHDQATIPEKLLAFGRAVNVTRGLSVVRTSVDHGTAYDLAWTGRADASAMSAALDLAARLLVGGGRARRATAPGATTP